MLTRTVQTADLVRQMFDPACARQVSAEIRMGGRQDAEPVRARFEHFSGEQLQVQLTPSLDEPDAPRGGAQVDVEFFLDGFRCQFDTHIQKVVKDGSAGPCARTTSLILAVPSRIQRQQRRAWFRVPLAARERIEVGLCATAPESPDCCPVGGRRIGGRLINLSAGGFGAVLHLEDPADLGPGLQLFAEFEIPDSRQTVRALAEVCHVRTVREGGGILVGVRFHSGVGAATEPLIRSVTQFVTREERRRLRRRK